ncbi:MAG TPA: CDP-diacylglycerol--glycerol-3-phosphate 3-phosphatidyltransferase [Isosphaeraceae bacterium]
MPRFWNVPNTLTLSRLALGAVAFVLISYGWFLGALVVFGLASLTDALDGYFARLLNQTSALGRQLDPLVDKLVIAAILIDLVTRPETGLAPWMVAVIVVRELLIQGIRSLIEGKGEPFGAKMAGKLKTTFQCLSIAAILLCLSLKPAGLWLVARDVLTWSAVGLTVYSGLGYVVAAYPRLADEAAAS